MSLIAFVAVLFSAVLHAAWNVAAHRYAKENAMVIAFLGLALALAVLLLVSVGIAIWGEAGAVVPVLPWMALSGLLQAVYLHVLFRGYRQHDVSSLYPLARGVGIIGVAIGSTLLLSERPSMLGYVALGVIIVGVACVAFLSKGMQGFRVLRASMGAPLAVGLTIASYSLVDKIHVEGVNPIVYLTGVVGFNLLALMPSQLRDRAVLRQVWSERRGIVVGSSVGSIGPYLIILFVYTHVAQVSYVVALREVSVAIGALLAVRYRNESIGGIKWIGIGLIALGAMLLKLS